MKLAVGRLKLPRKLHMMLVPKQSDLKPGTKVNITLKADQPTGKLTTGHIADIITKNNNHARGIKVRLTDGQIGRVQSLSASDPSPLTTNQTTDITAKYNGRLSHAQIGLLQTLSRSDFSSLKSNQSLTSNAVVNRGSPNQLLNTKPAPRTIRMVQDSRQDGYDPDSRPQSTSLLDYVRPPKQPKATAKARHEKHQDQESQRMLLQAEFPNLDSALVAAIVADYSTIHEARDVLKGLS
ncbi:MAG: hypothetical protein Q9202_006928 [Teloschistes flavicans]